MRKSFCRVLLASLASLFVTLVSLFANAAPAAPVAEEVTILDPSVANVTMKFTYVPHEAPDLPNQGVLECKHERIRDLPDWKVDCGNGEKVYTAHVVLRLIKRVEAPKTAIELLYWVTAPGDTPTSVRKYHSTSALIYLVEPTDLARINVGQGVDNDYAALNLLVERK